MYKQTDNTNPRVAWGLKKTFINIVPNLLEHPVEGLAGVGL